MTDEYLQKWLLKADHDLQAAKNEMAMTSDTLLTDVICFHAQQAVEKCLKAFLIFKNVEFTRSHSLEYLKELCVQQDKEFDSLDVGNLSDYAVEIRHPDDFYMPSKDEAEESISVATKIRDFVVKKIGK